MTTAKSSGGDTVLDTSDHRLVGVPDLASRQREQVRPLQAHQCGDAAHSPVADPLHPAGVQPEPPGHARGPAKPVDQLSIVVDVLSHGPHSTPCGVLLSTGRVTRGASDGAQCSGMSADTIVEGSFGRLMQAASTRGVDMQAQLARKLNERDQVVGNWKVRGVSRDGALAAQRVLGISAVWVLYTEGPQFVSTPAPALLPAAPVARSSKPAESYAPELGDVLEHLAQHLRDAKPDTRYSAAPLLARLAENPADAPRVIRALEALMRHYAVEAA